MFYGSGPAGFEKGRGSIKLSENFWSGEFDCPCTDASCTQTIIHSELVRKLQRLRDTLMLPVDILSGFRCPEHNDYLGRMGRRVAKNSTHLRGEAADVFIKGLNAVELAKELEEVGFMAIGISGGSWCHADLRDDKQRRWSY